MTKTKPDKCPKCGLPATKQFYVSTLPTEMPNWHCERCEAEVDQQEQSATRYSARREGLVPMDTTR